jgi:hypothetical protein
MDGQPFRYRVEEVGVRVYSVRDHQIDEDGKNDYPHDDDMERL